MTLDQFKKFVYALEEFYTREDMLTALFEPFNSSWTMVEFCPVITSTICNYIKEVFNDKGEWFDYWFYELDRGEKYTPDSCTQKDGTPIVIKTVEDIYNFLKENQTNE
jgi:hypothetical protein